MDCLDGMQNKERLSSAGIESSTDDLFYLWGLISIAEALSSVKVMQQEQQEDAMDDLFEPHRRRSVRSRPSARRPAAPPHPPSMR